MRVVDAWNSLPNSVIKAKSIREFEAKLDKHWERQAIKYDFAKTIVFTGTPGEDLPKDDQDVFSASGQTKVTDLDI